MLALALRYVDRGIGSEIGFFEMDKITATVDDSESTWFQPLFVAFCRGGGNRQPSCMFELYGAP